MKYAIVESGGKQFRAVEGGILEVDRLPAESGAKIKLEQVLLVADGENITVGTPLIKDNPVWTTVVEHFKGPKVNIFNYSPKKRIRVKIGHRQNYTRLLVDQIGGSELVKKAPAKVEKAVEVSTVKPALEKAGKVKKPVKADAKAGKLSAKTAASPKGKKPAAKAPASRGKTGTTKAAPKTPAKKSTTPKAETKKPSKGTTSSKGKAAPKKPADKK